VHDAANAILTPPLTALARALKELEAEQEIRVDLVADSFFVNKTLVRVPHGLAESVEGLRKTFARLQIQRLAFAPTVGEPELREFLQVFQKHWRTPTPQQLKQEPAGPVRVATLGSATDDVGMTGVSIDARQHLLKCYARLTILARDAVTRVQAGQPPISSQARRVVQALVDASKDRERLLTGLTSFPGFRGDLGAMHAAVAAHCLVMGRALGLSKTTLVDVVLAALQHQLGAAHPAHRTQGSELEDHEVPLLSMLATLQEGVSASAAWLGSAVFESCLPVWHADLLKPGALARLIAVPSAYERFTTPRPPHKGVTPDQALRLLKDQSGSRFDGQVVSLFVSIIGLYPIGSMVRLDDGSLAVVLDLTSVPSRPIVRVVRTSSGATSFVLDLSSDPSRAITGVADAAEENVNPTFFLLS
jgi:hypothetical protein